MQGAADDHEAWSPGLTPPVFWKNKDLLLSTNEEDAPSLVAKLLAEEAAAGSSSSVTLIKPTSTIYISPSNNIDLEGFDAVISCTPTPISAETLKTARVKHYLHLKCQTGKLGSRDLRSELARLPDFVASLPLSTSRSKILICCPTGKDLSVGTALAILCLYANDGGTINFAERKPSTGIDKNFIKHRLSWITTSNPSLNPSRSTLQSVNAVLLTTQDPKAVNLAMRHKTESYMTSSTTKSATEPDSKASLSKPDPSSEPPPSSQNRLFAQLATSTPWKFTRNLSSVLPIHPSGTVTGAARFTPCILPPSFPPTLLYIEEGEFVTDKGLKVNVCRKYVYQLVGTTSNKGEDDAGEERIVVKFFDDENFGRAEKLGVDGERIGGVFVEMGLLSSLPLTSTASPPSSSTASSGADGDEGIMVAKNKERHLCGEDLYAASWEFGSGMLGAGGQEGKRGENGKWWEVKYEVKGPKKDYVSVTRYTIQD